jgi:hypothetical protein
LWDCDVTEEQFRSALATDDPDLRAYWLAKLMRQAKPDEVFLYVSLAEIREMWDRVRPILGNERDLWTFLLGRWEAAGVG